MIPTADGRIAAITLISRARLSSRAARGSAGVVGGIDVIFIFVRRRRESRESRRRNYHARLMPTRRFKTRAHICDDDDTVSAYRRRRA